MNRPVEVRLALSDRFTGRVGAAAEAARIMHARWERDLATWEPHDWSEWD